MWRAFGTSDQLPAQNSLNLHRLRMSNELGLTMDRYQIYDEIQIKIVVRKC